MSWVSANAARRASHQPTGARWAASRQTSSTRIGASTQLVMGPGDGAEERGEGGGEGEGQPAVGRRGRFRPAHHVHGHDGQHHHATRDHQPSRVEGLGPVQAAEGAREDTIGAKPAAAMSESDHGIGPSSRRSRRHVTASRATITTPSRSVMPTAAPDLVVTRETRAITAAGNGVLIQVRRSSGRPVSHADWPPLSARPMS